MSVLLQNIGTGSITNMENFEARANIDHACLKTKKFEMENTFKLYNKMLERICES